MIDGDRPGDGGLGREVNVDTGREKGRELEAKMEVETERLKAETDKKDTWM